MSAPTFWRAAALLALACTHVACASAPAPVDRHFRLDTHAPALRLSTPGILGTLLVDRPRGDALLSQRPIVYRHHVDTSELGQHGYALWTDVPTSMLQHVMAEHFAAAGVASRVITTDVGIEGDYMLRGRLVRLEHVLGSEPGVEVELELFLSDRNTGALMLEGRYSAGRPVPDDGMPRMVAALGEAVAEALDAFVADLSTRATSEGLLPIPASPAP